MLSSYSLSSSSVVLRVLFNEPNLRRGPEAFTRSSACSNECCTLRAHVAHATSTELSNCKYERVQLKCVYVCMFGLWNVERRAIQYVVHMSGSSSAHSLQLDLHVSALRNAHSLNVVAVAACAYSVFNVYSQYAFTTLRTNGCMFY